MRYTSPWPVQIMPGMIQTVWPYFSKLLAMELMHMITT